MESESTLERQFGKGVLNAVKKLGPERVKINGINGRFYLMLNLSGQSLTITSCGKKISRGTKLALSASSRIVMRSPDVTPPQMNPTKYDRVRLLGLVSGDDTKPLLSAIEKSGVNNIKLCDNINKMMSELDDNIVDVLVCDYNSLKDSFTDVIQRLRRRKRGRNPFMIVIATVHEPDRETVKELIDAGVDDLVRTPIVSDRLVEGIEKFTHSRKPFVASHDYVGPTRRSAARDNEDFSSLMHVPNTLRSKAVYDVSDAELQNLVNTAILELEDKELETRGVEIDVTASHIAEAFQSDLGRVRVPALLDRMEELATDFYARTEEHAPLHYVNLAALLLKMVRRLRSKDIEQIGSEVKLLRNLARAIRLVLTVQQDAVDVMNEIVKELNAHPLKG